MNLLELFSGTCAFYEGLKAAGFKFEKIYYSEVDKHCIANTKYNHPEFIFLGDVTRITKGNFPDKGIDIITFGSPCQGFSQSGVNAGLEHEGSGLIEDAIRLVDELRPEIFIWENVQGLMSKAHQASFWKIIQKIISLGDYTLEWQLCNTNWVLPQNRSRMFLIGHNRKNKLKFGKVFPFSGSEVENHDKVEYLSWSANTMKTDTPMDLQKKYTERCKSMATLGQTNLNGDCEIYAGYKPVYNRTKLLSHIVQKGDFSEYLLSESQMDYLMRNNAKRFRKGFARILNSDEQTALTLLSKMFENWTGNFVLDNSERHIISVDTSKLPKVSTLYVKGAKKSSYLIGEIRTHKIDGGIRWGIEQAPTLKHGYRDCGSNMLVVGIQLEKDYFFLRRLTEIECERLQGLKDNHTQYGIYNGEIKPIIQSKRYQMLGNGITATMAEWIGKRLLKKEIG